MFRQSTRKYQMTEYTHITLRLSKPNLVKKQQQQKTKQQQQKKKKKKKKT